mmetsp:Transcript_9900/g.22170  ORF Transcript_9900/g.22170 Transcript_9900/m.22170 type:complete len:452 (+) Transcript_9900:48-1403(+)
MLRDIGWRAPHNMSAMRTLFSWCLLASVFQVVVDAKVQAGNIRIGGPHSKNRWKYMSKFGFNIGKGSYGVRVALHTPRPKKKSKDPPTEVKGENTSIELEVYLDEDWDHAEQKEPCNATNLTRHKRVLTVDSSGEWSPWVNGSLKQTVRPHIWYFALSDCKFTLQNYTHRLKYEFHAIQESGSEFSVEMRAMLGTNLLNLLLFTGFFYLFVKRCMAFAKSAGYVHPVIWTLAGGMSTQYIAQVFHTLHLVVYNSNGSGIRALEVLSEILFMLSQVIQTSLLILIGLGYTLIQSKIGELDLMIPMCFMIAVIHIMLVGVGKVKDDASYKYHENEGVVGWLLLVLRLLLFGWFLYAVRSTSNEGGMRIEMFMKKFGAAGTIYFLTYPAIFIVGRQFAPYLQHGIMSVSLMIMQMASNIWLSTLFLTRGEYFKVSSLSASDLPGGIKLGMMKEE